MDNRQYIGADRKREDVPTGWICGVAELTGFSMDWLGFGKGRVDYTTEGFTVHRNQDNPADAFYRQ
jgi:hypothetical protein